jgi:site-specific DNA recombinase
MTSERCSPTQTHFSANKPRWTRSHLANLLRHPFYIGKILWRGHTYEGKHEHLIDKRTWDQTQPVLDGKNRRSVHEKRQFPDGHGLITCVHCGYAITAELHKQRYAYYRCSQLRYREHPREAGWVCEHIIEAQVVAMLDRLRLPEEIRDWAVAYLERKLAKEGSEVEVELRRLKKKAADVQAVTDALLLKAAETEGSISDGFIRLARQRQEEASLLEQRIRELETGKPGEGGEPARIFELTQGLAGQYVTFPVFQKRQVVDSVFSNLRLDSTTLCGDYRLPFAILAEDGHRPVNSGRVDSNHRPLGPEPSALSQAELRPGRQNSQHIADFERVQVITGSPDQYQQQFLRRAGWGGRPGKW